MEITETSFTHHNKSKVKVKLLSKCHKVVFSMYWLPQSKVMGETILHTASVPHCGHPTIVLKGVALAFLVLNVA